MVFFIQIHNEELFKECVYHCFVEITTFISTEKSSFIYFFLHTTHTYELIGFITRKTTVLSKLQPLFQQQTDQVLFVFLHTIHTYELFGYVLLFALLFRFFSRAMKEQNAE